MVRMPIEIGPNKPLKTINDRVAGRSRPRRPGRAEAPDSPLPRCFVSWFRVGLGRTRGNWLFGQSGLTRWADCPWARVWQCESKKQPPRTVKGRVEREQGREMQTRMVPEVMVGCPCCGDRMESFLVVCWPCWRWTHKLTAGVYADPTDSYPCEITEDAIATWEWRRDQRMAV